MGGAERTGEQQLKHRQRHQRRVEAHQSPRQQGAKSGPRGGPREPMRCGNREQRDSRRSRRSPRDWPIEAASTLSREALGSAGEAATVYSVSTAGRDEAVIREYIQKQEQGPAPRSDESVALTSHRQVAPRLQGRVPHNRFARQSSAEKP